MISACCRFNQPEWRPAQTERARDIRASWRVWRVRPGSLILQSSGRRDSLSHAVPQPCALLVSAVRSHFDSNFHLTAVA